MAKKGQWFFFIAAALVLVLVAGGYILLKTYDYNSLKPRIKSAVMEATGRELTIGGDIGLDLGLTPALVLKDVSFQNAAWGSRAEMARIQRLEVEVSLLPLFSRQFLVKRLLLFGPDLLIERSTEGSSNIDFLRKCKDERKKEESPSEPLGALSALTFHQISVKRGLLQYRDWKSGRTSKLLISDLEAASAGLGTPIEVTCKGEMENIPFEAVGTVGALSMIARVEEPWPVAFDIRALKALASLNGSMRKPLEFRGIDLHFYLRTEDLKEILAAAGNPVALQGTLEIQGRISDPAARTLRISEMMLRLGDNRLSGSIEFKTGTVPLAVQAVVETDRLDLSPYIRKSAGEQGARSEKRPKKIFPDYRVSVSALKHVNGSIKIRAAKLIMPRLSINNLLTEMTLRNGELTINPLTAVVGAGMVSGNMKIGPRADTINITTFLRAVDLDMGGMLKEMGVKDVSGGRLRAEVALRADASSIAGWMRQLDGHVLIISDGGRINNRTIELLGSSTSSGIFRMLNPRKDLSYTEIRCMVCRFDIKSGQAKSTALVMDTPEMTVVGGGEIDLAAEELDIFLKPHPKQGLAGIGLSLGELTSPFKLAGTLSEPTLAIDPAQSALILGKAVGGVVLFGPVGIAAALAGGTQGEENPCLKAIEAAKSGKAEEEKGLIGRSGDSIKKGVKGLGDSLKGMFKSGPATNSENSASENPHREY